MPSLSPNPYPSVLAPSLPYRSPSTSPPPHSSHGPVPKASPKANPRTLRPLPPLTEGASPLSVWAWDFLRARGVEDPLPLLLRGEDSRRDNDDEWEERSREEGEAEREAGDTASWDGSPSRRASPWALDSYPPRYSYTHSSNFKYDLDLDTDTDCDIDYSFDSFLDGDRGAAGSWKSYAGEAAPPSPVPSCLPRHGEGLSSWKTWKSECASEIWAMPTSPPTSTSRHSSRTDACPPALLRRENSALSLTWGSISPPRGSSSLHSKEGSASGSGYLADAELDAGSRSSRCRHGMYEDDDEDEHDSAARHWGDESAHGQGQGTFGRGSRLFYMAAQGAHGCGNTYPQEDQHACKTGADMETHRTSFASFSRDLHQRVRAQEEARRRRGGSGSGNGGRTRLWEIDWHGQGHSQEEAALVKDEEQVRALSRLEEALMEAAAWARREAPVEFGGEWRVVYTAPEYVT